MLSHPADPPPLPRFVARVGVTGHRPNNPALTTGLERAIGAALHHMDEALRVAHATHRACYSSDAPTIRMVSGLAEGVDHLAVDLRPERWLLDAILPMPIARYRNDFAAPDRRVHADAAAVFDADLRQASSILELPGDPAHEDDPTCYARQGLVLARQIDLLVAVWDGAPARGLGGTADVVAFARKADVPVLWVQLAVDAPVVLLGSSTAQDLGYLPDRLAEMFDVSAVMDRSPPPPESATRQAAPVDAWTDLLARIEHAGAFGERLRRAAAPLLAYAMRAEAEDLADAIKIAILLLPVVGLRAAAKTAGMAHPTRTRVGALVREVGLPTALIDADYIATHCANVAETVAAPWPRLVARLRAIGAPALARSCLERTDGDGVRPVETSPRSSVTGEISPIRREPRSRNPPDGPVKSA